jgi:hypothetical protein
MRALLDFSPPIEELPMNPTARRLTLSTCALLGLFITLDAQALVLPAGKWRMDSETITPMAAEPMQETNEQCIAENFNPAEELTQANLGRQCQLAPTTDTDSEFAADMTCDMGAGATAKGNMRVTLNGETAAGEMQMTIDMAGTVMQMSNKWTGQRLGACDA